MTDQLIDPGLLGLPLPQDAPVPQVSLPELGLPGSERKFAPAELGLPTVKGLGLPPPSQIGLGLQTGVIGLGESVGGAVEAVGKHLGIETVSELGSRLRTASGETLRRFTKPKIANLMDAKNIDDVQDFFAYAIANTAPSSLATIGAAAAGTALAGPPGGVLAGYTMSYLLNAGEEYVNLREKGYDRPGAALAVGIPMALLDFVTPGRLFDKYVWRPTKDVAKVGLAKTLKQVGKEALISGATEGVTESLQELLGAGMEAGVTGEDFLSAETASRVLNAFAAAGAAGALLGGGVHVGSKFVGQARAEGNNTVHEPGLIVSEDPLVLSEEEEALLAPKPDTIEQAPKPEIVELPPHKPEDTASIIEQIHQDFRREEPAALVEPEDLFTDPASPLFSTAKGATPLAPTHDIFVLADSVDIPSRAMEFNTLYFNEKLDTTNTTFAARKLGTDGGMSLLANIDYRDVGLQEKPGVYITSDLALTPNQFDSILLHEMIHQKIDAEAAAAGKTVQPHGREFKKEALRVAKASGISIATKHDVPVNVFQSARVKTHLDEVAKGTTPALVRRLVDVSWFHGGGKFKSLPRVEQSRQPLLQFNRYASRAILDELARRGIAAEQVDKLIEAQVDRITKKYKADTTERASILEDVGTNIAALRELRSRVEPLITLYTYGAATPYIERTIKDSAPSGTKILVTNNESGYEYSKAEASNTYKIEADTERQAAERMGHVLAEKWIGALSEKAKEQLARAYIEETGSLPDTEVPTFSQWLFANASLRPELSKMVRALREHHALHLADKPFLTWLTELGTQSRLALPEVSGTPNDAKVGGEAWVAKRSLKTILKEIELEDSGGGREVDELQTSLDKTSWLARNVQTLLQFTESNKHIAALTRYTKAVRKFWADKLVFTELADGRAGEWAKLSKTESDMLSRFLFDQTLLSSRKKRKLYPDEQAALANKYKLPTAVRQLAVQVDEDMQLVLRTLKAESLKKVEQLLSADDIEAAARLKAEIDEDYHRLENMNYFPLNRFGRDIILVKAKVAVSRGDKTYREGETVEFRGYEREGLKSGKQVAKEALPEIQKLYPPKLFAVSTGVLTDQEFAFLGIPPSVISSMESDLNLSDVQKKLLRDISIKLSPGEGFKKHLLKRRGVLGFSEDGLRAYTNYMFHASNHYARLANYQALATEIHAIAAQVRQIRDRLGGQARTRELILQTVKEHYHYLMNPANEMAGLRSAIFRFYFVGNVRQLLVNLAQVPVVSFGYLSREYGTVATGKALNQAYTDVFQGQRQIEKFPIEEQRLLARAIASGIINQGYVNELAGAAHGDVLQRMQGRGTLRKLAGQITDLGIFPFKWTEDVNRRVTFLAAVRLAMAKGETDLDKLFEIGYAATWKTQGEYSTWNRMPIARGGGPLGAAAPLMFMFKTYQQQMVWFMLTQPARGRVMVAMLLAAGLMGLPGAEDVADIIDFLVTKMGQAFGWKNPHADARKWLRDTLLAMGAAPDLAMHGAARYTFGLYGLNMLVGLPIPALDLSGAVSLGRIVPGVEAVTSQTMDFEERVARAAQDIGGVAAGLGIGFGRALFSDDPNTFRRWQATMPPAIRGAVGALRAGTAGGYTDSAGNPLVPIDPHDNMHSAELVGYALLSSVPTRVRQKQEANWAVTEAKLYYLNRRELVLKDLAFATIAKDPEARADAFRALREYNQIAPPGFGITPSDMKRSLRSRIHTHRLRELGLPPSSRFMPLYREYGLAYPELDQS